MKRLVVIWLALALVMIAGFYGVSLARTCGGGGFEGTGCEPDDLLDPTSGPYVYGTFTVALDKSFCSTEYSECRHYNIHAVLRPYNSNKYQLFSYPVEGGDLCGSEEPITNEELAEEFASVPCTLRVGQVFGIPGTPVITKISVTAKQCRTYCKPQCNPATEECEACPEEMIQGSIKIRIVPPPK